MQEFLQLKNTLIHKIKVAIAVKLSKDGKVQLFFAPQTAAYVICKES